jgi:subtilase family serine protease
VSLAILVACATFVSGAGSAAAATARGRVGSAPRLPAATRVTGRLPASRRLALTLTLTSRNPLAMARMATAVATPGSYAYRRYLTVQQFARRFGAPGAAVRAVADGLRAAGFTVAPVQANHLTLSVSGTAAQIDDAFATRLDAVRLPDGRAAFADRAAPTLPAALAPDVDSIAGLSTLARPQSDLQTEPRSQTTPEAADDATDDPATGGPQPCAAALGASMKYGGYTADDIQAAYNFTGLYAAGADGAGQSVAVFELEKVLPRDLARFQACYATHARVSYVSVGSPRYTGDDEESALDIEQVLGLAPGVHVIVYQAQDSDEASVEDYARIVSQDRARTISVSWGACEAKITADGTDLSIIRAENKLFQEAAIQGQSILSASGDTGSAGCHDDLDSNRLDVQDPSSQPFATAVGGTTLYAQTSTGPQTWDPTGADGPLLESVWNDGLQHDPGEGRMPEATGGGISTLWAMPRYQRSAAPALNVRNADSTRAPCRSSGDCREVPDVSADGDPETGYVVYASGGGERGWTVEGGTSAAAPLWAALTADSDALPACRGASIGFENPSLYTLAATQPADLRDIATASPFSGRADNDATNTNRGLYPVTAGYDMTTGLGAPNAAALGTGLCGLRAPVFAITVTTPAVTRHATAHERFELTLHATDSGGFRLSFHARGLPPGLRISRRGVITGRPRYAGRHTVTVTASDYATNRATFRFVIVVSRHRRRRR